MKRILRIVIPAVLLVVLVVLLAFGYRTIQARDASVMKIVQVVYGLDEVADSLTVLNGGTVEDRDWESVEEERARKLGLIDPDVELGEDEQPEEAEATPEATSTAAAATPAQATATPRATASAVRTAAPTRTASPAATARPTSAPSNTPSVPDVPDNTTAPGPLETDPAATDAPGPVDPSETDTPSDPGETDGPTDPVLPTAPTATDPPAETPHVHNWVTETIAESGHYESRRTGTTTVISGYTTVVDSEGWTEYLEDGEIYHEPITHQEPVYTEQDVYEDVWVVDTPASSRTYCSICGATA